MFRHSKQSTNKACGTVGRAVASDKEIRGSNPVIGNFIYVLPIGILYFKLHWKDEYEAQLNKTATFISVSIGSTAIINLGSNWTHCYKDFKRKF